MEFWIEGLGSQADMFDDLKAPLCAPQAGVYMRSLRDCLTFTDLTDVEK